MEALDALQFNYANIVSDDAKCLRRRNLQQSMKCCFRKGFFFSMKELQYVAFFTLPTIRRLCTLVQFFCHSYIVILVASWPNTEMDRKLSHG